MRRLLGSETSDIRGNGHSFLAKYHIAKTLAMSSIWDDSIAKGALLGMLHAHLSETTTGMSQRMFLDSINDDSVAQGFQRFLDVNSRMSLAVVADLRLYVPETLKELNIVNDNPSLSLLYCLTSFTANRSIRDDDCVVTDLFRRPQDVPWDIVKELDLTEMCQILLEFGASAITRSELLTPFQALFAPRIKFGGEGYPLSSQARAVTRALLKHGQDPECALKFGKLRRGLPNCRAIHMSDAEMSRLLLEYGANVNALDGSGKTPLDIALSPNLETLEFEGEAQKVCDRISVLLDHGASITNHGEKHLKRCSDWLTEYPNHSTQRVLARLEQVPRITSLLQNRSALLDYPTSGETLLNLGRGSTSERGSSAQLARGAFKLPKRQLETRPRWTSTSNPNARQGQGDRVQRQSNLPRKTGVDDNTEIR
jgi:hypothetical protein